MEAIEFYSMPPSKKVNENKYYHFIDYQWHQLNIIERRTEQSFSEPAYLSVLLAEYVDKFCGSQP